MSCSGSPEPNGGAPVASSYSTAPSAYRSARWSTGRPVRPVASGARYARVPAISLWCVNSGRISANELARAKSTRHGAPSRESTTLAGWMSWCVTPRPCIPATARASPTARPVSSSTASGFAAPARLVPPASASITDAGYRGASASCATPATPRSRSSIATSCRTRRSPDGPSGSFRMTVPPAKNSRVTRVRSLWCTISARADGSRPGRTPPGPIRHPRMVRPTSYR